MRLKFSIWDTHSSTHLHVAACVVKAYLREPRTSHKCLECVAMLVCFANSSLHHHYTYYNLYVVHSGCTYVATLLCTDIICCYLFQVTQSRESSSNTKISQVIHTFPLLLTLVIIILYCMLEIIQERMFKSVRSRGVSCKLLYENA